MIYVASTFGGYVLSAVKPAQRAWAYFFSPSQRKEIRKNLSASSATLMTPAQAGGMSSEYKPSFLQSLPALLGVTLQ